MPMMQPMGRPAPPVHQPSVVQSQQPKPVEEKIEITKKMMSNLKILKNPTKMLEILKLDTDILQRLVLGLANESKLSLVVRNIKVREIWIGNLIEDTTKQDVDRAFSLYGKIESIELFNKKS